MKAITRYHASLIALHWVIAVLVIAMLLFGFGWIAQKPLVDRRTIGVLGFHMAGGAIIFVLMACRFIVRLWTDHPTRATIGHRWLDHMALLCHHSFYLLILLITATGAATAVVSNLAAIVFVGSIDPMPSSSLPYPAFAAHALLATALAILIIVHVLAAVYHQMIRKDGLFRRVSFNGMSQRLERHHPAG